MSDQSVQDTPLSLSRTSSKQTVTWELDRTLPSGISTFSPDPTQAQVIAHRKGALLVLAGPGTGKTATLTQAVLARLTDADAPLRADEILVLTFARKAAHEIRDRITLSLDAQMPPAVSTFHSLALAIVREFAPPNDRELKLLTGPEQEFVVRELLQGLVDDVAVSTTTSWPSELRESLTKRGITVEIRNALARARSLGIDSEELFEAAKASNKPEWIAISQLLKQYLDTISGKNELDYNELIFEAVKLTSDPEIQMIMRSRFKAIFVDEYQDTDPLQIALLRNLASPDASLICVGDPDQAIYAFRGADSRAIAKFNEDFEHVLPLADNVVLGQTRRFGATIKDAAYRVIARSGFNGLTGADLEKHRNLDVDPTHSGEVLLTHYESADVEAEEVAERIRELVTRNGYQWSDIGVLVRSGARSIAALERELVVAHIPVNVVFDELPISQEPAVALLLQAVEASLKPSLLRDPEVARELLLSPLGGLDADELRRIGRALRQHLRSQQLEMQFSDVLIAQALSDPASFVDLDTAMIDVPFRKLVALRNLLADTASMARRGRSSYDVLWNLWNGTSWPQALQSRAISQDAGSARAHHDLDAVITLFDIARSHDALPRERQSIATFLSAIRSQLIPANASERHFEPNAVSLMTAHRSKGLQWKAVFICGADEGAWPDVARRSSIFEPERLRVINDSVDIGNLPERAHVIDDERRLFFVACTRAKDYLHVSTTSLDPESGRIPSRFLRQLLPNAVMPADKPATADIVVVPPVDIDIQDSTPRFSLLGLVTQLRRIASDSSQSNERREAAVQRLAYLSTLKRADGSLLVPAADPRSWWGLAALTENDLPIDDPSKPVYVRGSSLQGLFDCSLSWFMSQRAKAEEASGIALVFGSIVHAVAEAAYLHPEWGIEELEELIDHVWKQVPSESSWSSESDRQKAIDCIHAFSNWRKNRTGQQIGAEVDFDGMWNITRPDGTQDTVRLKGQIDYVELTVDGQLFIADFKTLGKQPTEEETEKNMQLAIYQAAAELGLLHDDLDVEVPADIRAGGAQLVLVRHTLKKKGNAAATKSQSPVNLTGEEKHWIEKTMGEAADIVRAERFLPTLGEGCKYCNIKTSCPLVNTGKPVIS